MATSAAGSISDSPAALWHAAACPASQVPITASTAAASTPVTTRQMVALDGAVEYRP
jgi:hypothetical protein